MDAWIGSNGADVEETSSTSGAHRSGLLPPMYGNCVVQRDGLLRELTTRARSAGIVCLYAPKGFGKTALLLQYADSVRRDPARGFSEVIEAEGSTADELAVQLRPYLDVRAAGESPLIAIDNVSFDQKEDIDRFVHTVRALRDAGYELVLTCTPAKRALVHALGDSVKINAQALTVHPREYSDWARTYTISSTLDVYGLTQGVPAIVAALQVAVEGSDDLAASFESTIVDVYGSILVDMAQDDPELMRIACLMLLVGKGDLLELERAGFVCGSHMRSKLLRDYPVFGFDSSTLSFACLGRESAALKRIREIIVATHGDLVRADVGIHMNARREDEGVALARQFMEADAQGTFVESCSHQLVLTGHARFVLGVARERGALSFLDNTSVSLVLAVYMASLTTGDFRVARLAAASLARQSHAIDKEISGSAWEVARALRSVWSTCQGIDLPNVHMQPGNADDTILDALDRHARLKRNIATGQVQTGSILHRRISDTANEIDIVRLIAKSDAMLAEVLSGVFDVIDERDSEIVTAAETLHLRGLAPVEGWLRFVTSVRRLYGASPVCDERAFIDEGNIAIRVSDTHLQLFCMLLEGWSAIMTGQAVNAQFRAQQVQKLVDEDCTYVRSQAYLLEQCAHISNVSRMTLREEFFSMDLGEHDVGYAEAWARALHLSAAQMPSELSAWFSLNKTAMFEDSFRLPARIAMLSLGDRADALRRLLPKEKLRSYLGPREVCQLRIVDAAHNEAMHTDDGVAYITLFGGFRAERNGHTLTDARWKRKKCTALAARLALSMGSFVGRKELTEEMWPKIDYKHGRENLYVATSSLRGAMGQTATGPQYVITQSEGIAFNSEYVMTDALQFERYAREILLKHAGISGHQVVEMCLKLEELYKGELFVPQNVDPTFFLHMRSQYQNRFVNCMIRGIDTALDNDDLGAASWLVEAGLKVCPRREDLVRRAMRTYEMSGRRNDVVNMYQSHLHFLDSTIKNAPEPETQRTYEQIIERAKTVEMLA